MREEKSLSISELARQAGVGKSSLSDIEAGRRSPTVETLSSICRALEVPLAALVGGASATEPEASSDFEAVLVSVRELPNLRVEVFRIELPRGASHISPEHGEGVSEHLTVVQGAMWAGPIGAEKLVRAGESASWSGDEPHTFEVMDGPAEGVLVALTPK